MIAIMGPGFFQAQDQPNETSLARVRKIGAASEKLVASAEGMRRFRNYALPEGVSGNVQSLNERFAKTDDGLSRVRVFELADGRKMTETITVQKMAEGFVRTVVHDDGSGNAVITTTKVVSGESGASVSHDRIGINESSDEAEREAFLAAVQLAFPEVTLEEAGPLVDENG